MPNGADVIVSRFSLACTVARGADVRGRDSPIKAPLVFKRR